MAHEHDTSLSHDDHGPAGHVVPVRVYLAVFTALLVLTAITVVVANYDLGAFSNVVAMGIAFTKATLVVLFFMHVKYNTRLIQITVVSGLVWLVILFAHTFSDYLTRTWL